MVAIFKMDVIENLIPDKMGEITILKIEGKHFVFDKESLKEYNENFDDDYHIIFIENGYLCRYPKWDKEEMKPKNFTFFHIYLMEEEMDNYLEENPDKEGPLQAHHLTMCKRINIKKYLKVLTKDEHINKLHNGYYGLTWLEFDDW